ncbi:TPA: hypothetical protein SF999_002924 [Staphylococcus aureus]|nr:hypothetical protein [Staphylococcus aureus]HEG8959073.1 hypothetical protein [Staphylococcus aureus]HEG8997292.1 hypothetical protein [Staphylococcus aureus]HEG8997468.1 hypothetical protein [Staphylococcus aureus]HEH2649224.1 hypothetical protein [Staphylococcus aureus]
MKNLKSFFIKNTLVLTSTALLFSSFEPVVHAAENKEVVKTVENDNVEFNELLEGQEYIWEVLSRDDEGFKMFLDEQRAFNPNFDLNSSVFANNSMTLNSNKPTPRGPIGATLKAIKALSPSLRHGGTAISWIIKPLSRKHAVLVKKYSRKMSNAIDRLDKSTKSAVENAFVKAGIPRSDAKTLTYIVFLVI